jgi:DNA modification methylase/rubredoxin
MTDNLDNLRSIEGFPKGKDEDLLALSSPPYYTAYPNPHIVEFISKHGKPFDAGTDDYHCEPYVSDVSEGKNDPIYNAHSYHTKVPYKAIVPFIEHYTQPGDIVFDGFCGTGMTGIAAQDIGRKVILSDLSTIATFISANYNLKLDKDKFLTDANNLLYAVNKECGWMYETGHKDGKKGIINYTVWSDVFICPYCTNDVVFFDVGFDEDVKRVKDEFSCPKCHAALTKSALEHSTETIFDTILKKTINRNKQVPVLINYSVGTKRYEKRPDVNDLEIIEKVEKAEIPYWVPDYLMMFKEGVWGDIWRAGYHYGVTHSHHFYYKRNLWVLSALWGKTKNQSVRWALSSIQNYINKKQSFTGGGGGMPGVLYIASLVQEKNVIDVVERKVKRLGEVIKLLSKNNDAIVSTQSSTDLRNIPDHSIDYIFIDPPFGANIMYSEGSFLWEAWLRVFTNNTDEAIVNGTQHKELPDYRNLMFECFSEMFRILKPGRWITVEFHNSQASVWNSIQDALSRAGFVVAQVTVLDKQQGSFKQVTSAGAVKNDLIINAYKPRSGFTEKLLISAGRGLEAFFLREHLHQLPLAANVERSKEMLYSKYLAYYVQHGYQVMYNGEQFYRALLQWGLEERDGYWFSDEAQANEYEKRKAKTFGKGGIQAQAVLFVSDERSARQWIWNFLDQPKSYDEIYTDFVKALQTSEDEIPEVKTILEESFVRTNGHWKRPDQLTQAELEKKRQERLLRQFEEYLSTAKANQKLKEVRLEAVIAGFTECYRSGRYKDILTIGRKLDKSLLENSTDLYDFIDIAEAKVEQ